MNKIIKAADFARDFRLGMDDRALMMKYRLTEEQLEQIFEELWRRNLVSGDDDQDYSDAADSEVTFSFPSEREDAREST